MVALHVCTYMYIPGHRLDVNSQLQFGQLVHIFVDGLAHFGHSDELSDLAVSEVIKPVPGKVLFLNPTNDIVRQLLELSQRSHGLPPGAAVRIDHNYIIIHVYVHDDA